MKDVRKKCDENLLSGGDNKKSYRYRTLEEKFAYKDVFTKEILKKEKQNPFARFQLTVTNNLSLRKLRST